MLDYYNNVNNLRPEQIDLAGLLKWHTEEYGIDLPYWQVTEPSELEPDMDIALIKVELPLFRPVDRKVLCTASLFREIVGDQRSTAALRTIRKKLVPKAEGLALRTGWRGRVVTDHESNTTVFVTYGSVNGFLHEGRPEDVPPIENPFMTIYPEHEDMGIVPVAYSERFMGQWLPYVTVCFDEI